MAGRQLAAMKAKYDEVGAAIEAVERDDDPKRATRRLRTRVNFGAPAWDEDDIIAAAEGAPLRHVADVDRLEPGDAVQEGRRPRGARALPRRRLAEHRGGPAEVRRELEEASRKRTRGNVTHLRQVARDGD
jgi:hypothetical protein